ncbi:hypothetical protein ACF07S_31695 [Streptomyces sp. NPDC016640]|uniref:hypothetical protein n=1 Tax=Streptomyces sp. NPDC016640 TaxID=3364969 RepID=UPI0036F66D1B
MPTGDDPTRGAPRGRAAARRDGLITPDAPSVAAPVVVPCAGSRIPVLGPALRPAVPPGPRAGSRDEIPLTGEDRAGRPS